MRHQERSIGNLGAIRRRVIPREPEASGRIWARTCLTRGITLLDPWPYSQRQSRGRERIPLQIRMGTRRCREPSPDPPPILEKWLRLGSRVISLKDDIRQIQRRVVLLRLRKASADGILARIVQIIHECVTHASPPAQRRAF